jgi:hypothetical protein
MVIWGDESAGEEAARMTFPGIGERLAKDPPFVRWLTRLQRYAASPGDQARFGRVWFTTDARSVLPLIQVPAAVLMRTGWIVAYVQEARWTADQIPGAQLVPVPGDGGRRGDPGIRPIDRGRARGVRSGARHRPVHRHRRLV